ncbi:MAG: hypothetical protein KatS3mg087_0125 [Patescibacteria group bacterium]|nr:MAG: hypothetical protein KatS3mg087_0125 [Patescibacteria group bacterium]
MHDDVFERVAKLVEEYTKTAEDMHKEWEEYDAGKHVEPKGDEYSRALNELLEEYYPSGPDSHPEASNDNVQGAVEDAYPTAPDVEVADEDNGPDVEAEGPSGGEEAFDDAEKVAHLSDDELLRKYASFLNEVFITAAAVNSDAVSAIPDSFIKAAAVTAQVAEQAKFDAGLVAGYLKTAFLRKKAVEEAIANAPVDPEEAMKFFRDLGISEEELIAALSDIVKEHPELASAVAGQANQDVNIDQLMNMEPEQIREILKASPDLAAAVRDVLTQMHPEGGKILDDFMSEGGGGSDAVPFKGEETPEEEAAEHAALMGGEASEEAVEKAIEEAAGEKEDEDSEEGDEVKGANALQKLAALDSVLNEMHLSPDDIVVLTRGGLRAEEAVKVANAVKKYRLQYKPTLGKSAERKVSPELRSYLKDYLYELLNS